jgi:hypothetical protein
MLIGLTTFELHLPQARSLKEKRKVVKSLVERIHQRYRVSVLEAAHHDLHQRAEIAVVLLARDEVEIDRIMNGIRDTVDQRSEALVTRWDERVLEGVE